MTSALYCYEQFFGACIVLPAPRRGGNGQPSFLARLPTDAFLRPRAAPARALEAPFATSARKRLSSSDVQMRDTLASKYQRADGRTMQCRSRSGRRLAFQVMHGAGFMVV